MALYKGIIRNGLKVLFYNIIKGKWLQKFTILKNGIWMKLVLYKRTFYKQTKENDY